MSPLSQIGKEKLVIQEPKNDIYIIPQNLLENLEELILQLQNVFLDIYSNYQIKKSE